MNKRQVLILWVVALLLGGAVVAVKLGQTHTSGTTTQRKPGETLFASFPAAEVATIEIAGAAEKVSLVKKADKWGVTDRDGFPANTNFTNTLLRTLADLKVTRGMEAGPSFAPRFGMDEASADPKQHGLTATFKDASGKELAKVSLGKSIEGGAEAAPMMGMGATGVGRYVWNHADASGFYAVNEMFPSVSADPKRWLADGFVNPEKVRTIEVTEPGKDTPAWKLTRETAEAEFKLEAAQPAEVLNSTIAGALKGLFSYARFEDVVPAARIADRASTDPKRTATLTTFDGFRYVIGITPAKPVAAPATPNPEAMPPASDNFLVTVDVSAELPKERVKAADEKPEDAKAKDEEFATQHKALEEKLAKEKAFAGITFEVGKSLVEPLLNDRKALTTEAAPAPNPGAQQFPGGMIMQPGPGGATGPIEAVTPPIQVPPVDEGTEEDSGQ